MGLSLSQSLTITKKQDETRNIIGMILDWFGKVKVGKLSLVWLGQVQFGLVW